MPEIAFQHNHHQGEQADCQRHAKEEDGAQEVHRMQQVTIGVYCR